MKVNIIREISTSTAIYGGEKMDDEEMRMLMMKITEQPEAE